MAAKNPSARDLLQRMRAAALRQGAPGLPVSAEETQGPPPQLREPEQAVEPPAAQGRPRQRERRVRYTLDLDRSQHRFLRQFALDAEVDASAVMRALLRLLAEDEALAKRVRATLE